MKIEKRGSSYRVRLTENGKTYSVTVPYKPTQKEAWELMQDKINKRKVLDLTFADASEKYVKAKSNVLSPSTIRGYNTIIRSIPEQFMSMDISKITDYDVQNLINDYAEEHEPKSVRNLHGFVSAVIRLFIPSMKFHTTLPQKKRKTAYIPSVEDVKRLIESARDTEYFVALNLASMSLRRSEICALTIDDLDGNKLTVNKALVPSDDGYKLKDTPKTDASYRTIVIPDDLAERIRKQGYIFKYQPQAIDQYIRRTLPKLGIPQFSVHKMRHFFASYAHELGYSDATIMSLGGWNSDVMKRVYRHSMNEEESKNQIAKDFGNLF